MKSSAKKSLYTLQPSATSKENLVGGRRVPHTQPMKPVVVAPKVKVNVENASKVHIGSSAVEHRIVKPAATVTADDLTEDSPSEGYYEVLAEKRRVALEKVLKENDKLNERVELLEEENESLRKLVEETTKIVQFLNEVVAENAIEESGASDSSHSDGE